MSLRAHQITTAACGAGLAVHAASLARVHGLLAGADPTTPGFAAAGGLLLGWGLAARRGGSGSRTACLIAAGAAAATGFVAPIPLGLMTGWPAALITALLAAIPAALVGRFRPGSAQPALLFGGGLGALLAGLLLLPHLGPTLAAVLGALLLATAALLTSESEEPGPADSDSGLSVEPLAGLLIAGSLAAGLSAALRPWPFGVMAAGCAALGLALAPLLPGKGRARILPAGLVALVLVPWSAGLLPFTVRSLIESGSRSTVSAGWGAIALLIMALAWGFGPGLLGGLAIGRPRPLGTAIAGLLVLLAGLVQVSSLASHPATLLLLAGVLVASLLPSLGSVLPPARSLAAAGVVAALVLLSPFGTRGGFGRDAQVTRNEEGDPTLTARGVTLANGDGAHRADELLAGHAAGFLAAERDSVLVVGPQTGGALVALQAQGFREIAVRDFSSDLARIALMDDLEGPPLVAAAPSAWPERQGGWDALVIQAEDPSQPEHAPVFTESAYRRAASLLAPGGVFVQRIRISRLGPEGLVRVVRTAQAAFPETWILTADLGRDGSVLMVGRPAIAGSRGLPWNRMILNRELNPRFDSAVALSLKEALLFKSGDLLNTVAVGPRELAELQPEVPAFDAWTPGTQALRFPAPEGPAVGLTRAMLYARIGTVELPVDLEVQPSTPPWQDHSPFAGLETQFGDGWDSGGGMLRFGNRFRPVLGDFGLYRDLSRKIAFERAGGRIEVVELERTVAGADTVAASARSFLDEHATRTAEARVNGHLALIVIREPSMSEQHVHMTWHCPVQGKLYAADYRLIDGRPGLFEEPLKELGDSLRCSHAPAIPPR